MIRKKCECCGRVLWMRSSAQEMCYRCFTEKQKQLGNTTGTCAICGKEFVKTRSNQKYCGPDCQKAGRRVRLQNYKRTYNQKKEIKSENMRASAEWKRQEKARAKMREIHAKSNLDQNIDIARTQGISYGELQARRYLANMPPIDIRIGGDR